MLRLADEFRPRVVLVENVASGARRWVCPVRGSLEALGYRTAALNIGVDDCGGPHRRKRIFILAYAERDPLRLDEQREAARRAPGELCDGGDPELGGSCEAVADADSNGRVKRVGAREERGGLAELENCNRGDAQPRLGGEPHGVPARVARWPAGPSEEQHAWEPPRTSKDAKERAAKLKAIGNAVSPIQAYHVGLWARELLGI
jgi:DNA (cytosine-5)-methyltransferase 1